MSTFQDRVQDYVGTFSDTGALSDWLTAAARIISDRIPIEKLEKHATDQSVTGDGLSAQGMKIFEVHKSGRRCVRKDVGLKAAAIDSNSIHYGTTRSPVYLFDGGKLYIYAGGSATTGTILAYSYPTVLYSASSATGFPNEYEQGLVIYASLNAQMANIYTKNSEINSLSLTDVTPPTAPSAPSFSWSDTSYSTASASSASWVDALIDTISSTTIDISALTPPTYTKPTTTASFTNLNTYVATEEDLEKADSEATQQKTILDMYQMDLYNELNEFNKENISYQAYLTQTIQNAQLAQQRLIEQSKEQIALNKFNEEKALEAALKNNDLAAQVDIQNKSKALESDIINKTNSLRQQIEEYTTKLQRHQGEIAQYSAQVNEEVSKYGMDREKKVSEISTMLQMLQQLNQMWIDTLRLL